MITLFGCDQTSYVYKILHETQDPTARPPGGRVRQPTAVSPGGRVNLPPGRLHISLQKACTAKPCHTLPPEPLAVGLDSLPPGCLAVRYLSTLARGDGPRLPPSHPTARESGGSLSNPTARGSGGNKRVKSRFFFERGSDLDFVCKKGQNMKFSRERRGQQLG